MPIRILEIVNIMDRAGLETMLMNHYRHFDRNQVQLDFLTHRPVSGAYDDEIKELGGRIFRAPRLYPQNALAYRRFMKSFFDTNRYPVVHSHIDAMSLFPLSMAKACDVPVRMAHSHSDSVDHDFKFLIKEHARKKLPEVATHYLACSRDAGAYLFGKNNIDKVQVIKNAIDINAFSYDSDNRKSAREEIGANNSHIVIGHVGRFCQVKNQSFLIELISKLHDMGEEAILVLVGDGELRSEVQWKAESLGMGEYVKFLGLRTDIARLMQSFDAFVFPSLHEGVPLSLIEAQSSGLAVVASDRVSSDSLILPNCIQLSLDAPIGDWATAVCKTAKRGRVQQPSGYLIDAGYDIEESSKRLMDLYIKLYKEAEVSCV